MSKIPKRNGVAQAALGRKPTTMKHRNAPRGGARNDQPDLLEEAEELCPHGYPSAFGNECGVCEEQGLPPANE